MRYAGGEDGSRTRLDGFAGRIHINKIKDLAENHTFHHMSLLNLNLDCAQKFPSEYESDSSVAVSIAHAQRRCPPLIDHQY